MGTIIDRMPPAWRTHERRLARERIETCPRTAMDEALEELKRCGELLATPPARVVDPPRALGVMFATCARQLQADDALLAAGSNPDAG
jgi:hypothetical protein